MPRAAVSCKDALDVDAIDEAIPSPEAAGVDADRPDG
jgi:hypothetical protein